MQYYDMAKNCFVPVSSEHGGFNQMKGDDSRESDSEDPGRVIDRFKASAIIFYEHSERVGYLAGRLAWESRIVKRGWSREETIHSFYRTVGLYHDIGKYAIPYEILQKPGRLTDEEMQVVRIHPELGEELLRDQEEFREMLPAVRHHHERWDGRGYPDGLRGRIIPVEARILSIVDTYDAITSDRPYRKGSAPEAAIVEIVRCAGTQFDPSLAKLFCRIMDRELKKAV